MAQKRMIDKKISVSDQIANLSVHAQLVFTWAIPHADDLGLLPSPLKTLKAMIVPMWDMESKDFKKIIEEIVKEGLWEKWEWRGQSFYKINNFHKYQVLRKDRQ